MVNFQMFDQKTHYPKGFHYLVVKERRPYPISYAKLQSEVLGGWVGKDIFIMTFSVTKWFQRKSHFKRKNILKR